MSVDDMKRQSHPGVLTVRGAVAFSPATTLSIPLNGTEAGVGYPQLRAGGPIDLAASRLSLNLGFAPPAGTSFEIVANTGSAPVRGTFSGLGEGAVFTQGGYQFQISYQAGTGGNGIVLTRLP